MDQRPFVIFGPSHWVAVVLTAAAAWGLIRLFRLGSESGKKAARYTAAWILFLAVAADPPITWLRYAERGPEMAWSMVHETAWPFYLCDWAAIACGLALIRRSQRLAELGWCWGLGGTLQGLVYPSSLSYDWPNPDWYAFFAEHGGVPAAGLALVFGMGLRPEPGVVWRAWLWLLVYFACASVLNLILRHAFGYTDANYGFVCTSEYSPFGILGPWPGYVFAVIALLGFAFAGLTAPFVGRHALDFHRIRPFRRRRIGA